MLRAVIAVGIQDLILRAPTCDGVLLVMFTQENNTMIGDKRRYIDVCGGLAEDCNLVLKQICLTEVSKELNPLDGVSLRSLTEVQRVFLNPGNLGDELECFG